jgi:hypothetical protein
VAENKILDFDATGDKTVDFVRSFFEHCRDAQRYKHDEFERIYKLYRGQMNMDGRDVNRANIHIPKLYSVVETILPHYIDAIFGLRPYIPIEVTNRSDAGISDAQTDLLDCYLNEADFFSFGKQLFKYSIIFGLGYIEVSPIFEKRKIKRVVPEMMTAMNGMQVQTGQNTIEEDKVFFRLGIRTYAPWQIYRDPACTSLDDARGVIKFRSMISKRNLKKMAEAGYFPDFDVDKLDSDTQLALEEDWGRRLATSLGVTQPKSDDDLGVWMSYESKDRYVDIWNFKTVLRDIPNPYKHGKINLTRVINSDDPNPSTSYWGLGEGKPIEILCNALDDHWNQTFDNHNLQNQGMMFYDEDAMSVDQLVAVAGNRIPVTPQLGGKISDAIWERPTPGLSPDHYNIPNKIEFIIDDTSGIGSITRGMESNNAQTAREAILRRQAGDARMKLKIKIGEEMGLKDLGEKSISIIDQFATPDDIVSKIGAERAAMIPSANPADLDGGYNFAFKGSSRMSDAQIKRQDAKDVYQLTLADMAVNPQWRADWLLQHFDVPDSERRKAVYSQQDVMALQQQAALQEAAAGAGESTRSVSDGGVLGVQTGQTPSGKDQNEKLSMGF